MANHQVAGDLSLGGDFHILSLRRFPINLITNQSFVGILDNKGQKPWYWLERLHMFDLTLGSKFAMWWEKEKIQVEWSQKKKKGKQIQDLKV